MKKTQLSLTVNGQNYQLAPLPGETLADLLRNRLKLTGTKIGCNEAECGACTVIMDGEPVLSCSTPAERADGKTITTIEGLAKPEKLHPLQEAFIKHGAVQCGFCIPGQIMTSYALLQKKQKPSSADIRHALKDTLCRCAGYPTIENAILAAAESLQSGQPVAEPQVPPSATEGATVGTLKIRPDAVEKVTGEAIFTDDLKFENMLFAAVKRAGVPHAFVQRINVDKAREVPGVVTIMTARDVPGENIHGLVILDWPVMVGVGERVRYVGDAIAIVAAESQEAAKAAVELIEVDFDLQPVVSDAVQARKEGQPQIHEKGNLLKHIKVRKGDPEIGFAEADVVLEHTFHTPATDHLFMEPECSIAVPEGDRMLIYVGSQIPYQDRTQVARALGWEETRVRIVGQLMGGGFGGKEDIAGQIHAALLANATGQPVKLLFDRHESLIVHPKRHATQIKVKLGAKKDGTLVAAKTELYGDTGAYASLGEKVLTRATTHSAGPYKIPHVHADCYAMYTNNPPAGAFRGFGVLQSAFAFETMMDNLAEILGLDRIELRRKNALRVGDETSTGQIMRESAGLVECIDKVESSMLKVSGLPYEELFKARRVPDAEHLVRAWGFASAFKNTGLGGGADDTSGAEVELYEDGSFQVRSAAAELGQGLVTIMRMMVAEELAVPAEQVSVLVMDTDLTPNGGPTTASRQTYVTGNASRLAAKTLREAITATLSEKFDMAPEKIRFAADGVHVNGHTLNMREVYSEMKASGKDPRVLYEYHAPETKPLGQGGDMHVAFSFASQAAEVEVNTNTGEVRVLHVISANDVGRAINPLGLRGQVEGGVVMGVGHALLENFITKDGYVVTDRMSRYRIPSIMHTPEITSIIVEDPTKDGPYGAKGVGEIVLIPTPPAITNAIYNAVGVRFDSLPVDQEKLLWAMEENKRELLS
ncbi:MAG: aldehyde oxidoreductase [Chloroflexi bacterium HGW-Chloroflexi-6]|nr:MAG: aldehyde oxidoreductase [Chloroflexi bacterium HGW-Chloroflexi-6]